MNLIYQGKTKNVYATDNQDQVLLKFKDDVTGTDGVFDPGANTVGLTIEGAGKSGLKMTTFFYRLMNEKGINTHFVDSNIEEQTMLARKATVFGKGLEVICRYKAVGSFFRRYGDYCKEGQILDHFVEITIKDDHRGDPVISDDALAMLGVLTHEEYKVLKQMTIQICDIVKEELAKKNLDLYDIKLEFGRDSKGNVILIDEISGGNMRVYQNGVYLEPLKLEKEFLG
ncbi:MAG: phosphoribosylaminoimidazolesuccinocarboxamide synthase [Brumimicrobium sp.]|nr:phosphoribosylaminoimidazolesuccinocarboxamide synthase [Brumimicrobium sp.]MCO5267347.1 phosphoribosylaminoimidazolesuccinocarboxamide synthase [Brumimicrobium sp.]